MIMIRIDTNLFTSPFKAMIVSLFPVVSTVSKVIRTVITGRVSHESMLKRFISFLVPLKVSNHLFLFHKYTRITIQAVKVLSII